MATGLYPISTLLNHYQNGKLCLPEIQRSYVWKPVDVASLIDSLYRDIPIGLLLFWKPTNLKHLKPLKGGKLNDPEIAIIDGQQRVTSLNEVAQDTTSIMFHIDDEEFKPYNKRMEKDLRWVSVSKIWQSDPFVFSQDLAKKLKMSQASTSKLGSNVWRIRKIKEVEPQYFIISSDDPVHITNIFRRINESGKKVQKAEIALAVGALRFPGVLGKRLKKLQKNNVNWKTSRQHQNSFFVNALAGISTKTSIKMLAFKEYLLQTNAKELKQNLRKLEDSIPFTYNFLDSSFGITEKNNLKLIFNVNILLVLVNYFASTKGRRPKKNSNLLSLWTFLAFHSSQYSGKKYSHLDEDLRAIDPIDTIGTIKTWLKSIKDDQGTLRVKTLGPKWRTPSAKFTLFFALKLNSANDWWTGDSIESMDKTEFHHIFPQTVLRAKKISESKINDPRNIAIVSKRMNRMISGRPPEKYFRDASLISDPDRIHTQFIPKDKKLWKVENYEKFLEKRGELIMKKLNDFISKLEPKI